MKLSHFGNSSSYLGCVQPTEPQVREVAHLLGLTDLIFDAEQKWRGRDAYANQVTITRSLVEQTLQGIPELCERNP